MAADRQVLQGMAGRLARLHTHPLQRTSHTALYSLLYPPLTLDAGGGGGEGLGEGLGEGEGEGEAACLGDGGGGERTGGGGERLGLGGGGEGLGTHLSL